MRRPSLFFLFFAGLVLTGLALALPIGPSISDRGVVVEVRPGIRGGEVARYASPRFADERNVPLGADHGCSPGDRIAVERWSRVFGVGVRPASRQPCTAPFS